MSVLTFETAEGDGGRRMEMIPCILVDVSMTSVVQSLGQMADWGGTGFATNVSSYSNRWQRAVDGSLRSGLIRHMLQMVQVVQRT